MLVKGLLLWQMLQYLLKQGCNLGAIIIVNMVWVNMNSGDVIIPRATGCSSVLSTCGSTRERGGNRVIHTSPLWSGIWYLSSWLGVYLIAGLDHWTGLLD